MGSSLCSENYQHMVDLMQAHVYAIKGEHQQASTLFATAISSARNTDTSVAKL